MKIAIIDSGVFESHPHIGRMAGAVQITSTGLGEDPIDRLGHGTAVAAAIREKAPDAELYSVKVFGGRLAVSMDIILRALAWCRDQRMDVINLSLGTTNAEHREHFLAALPTKGLVISAAGTLPGTLPGVIGVAADEACRRDRFEYRKGVFYASPYPRPIDGVSASRNLQGVSFAVANMTGLVARMESDSPDVLRRKLINAGRSDSAHAGESLRLVPRRVSVTAA